MAECVAEAAALERIYDSTTTGSQTKVFEQTGYFMKENAVKRIAHKAGIQRYLHVSGLPCPLAPSGCARSGPCGTAPPTGGASSIIFTEECSLDTSNMRRYPFVSRFRGTATVPENICRSFHSSRKTIMVWGAIVHGKKSPLIRLSGTGMGTVNSARYIKLVSDAALRPFVLQCELEELTAYVEDNAPIHNSKATAAA
ncbi:hypothetical protein OC844_006813, partial [Tilletia horrida]